MAPPMVEVPVVDPEVVRQMKELAAMGWGAKAIAAELEIARNTVRRYLRGAAAGVVVRPGARKLDDTQRKQVVELFKGTAEGNAVVVRDLLAADGIDVGIRTVQRAVEGYRRSVRAEELATVRYETEPGRQMQIDFGEKKVRIGGVWIKVHLLVAVLGYSRRIFVKAFLAERQDDWREGIAEAFRHFGGIPLELLGDNAKALVISHDREAQTVVFHPKYVAFCKDWGVTPRACAPYRARTKGKTESGVKYAKRNALAGREFASFAELEAHLAAWMLQADSRVHGTTHEVPNVRFEREERVALRPLPARPIPSREQRRRRVVANDSFVNIDTIRYSVPYNLVREGVEVAVGESEVRVYFGGTLVARHLRCYEPHAIVRNPEHFAGLHRPAIEVEESPPATLEALGRSLADYAEAIGQEAA